MLELFLSFAKIGIMTFGGGLAMLPMLERELVDNKHWVSKEDLMDYYAIGQCTPGIIAVNVATFVGRKKDGVLAGIVATLGIVFPSVVIISLIAAFLSHFADIEWVAHAFAGARIAVCVLVLNSVIKLGKSGIKGPLTAIIYITVTALSIFLKLSPIILVIAAAVSSSLILSGKKEAEK